MNRAENLKKISIPRTRVVHCSVHTLAQILSVTQVSRIMSDFYRHRIRELSADIVTRARNECCSVAALMNFKIMPLIDN